MKMLFSRYAISGFLAKFQLNIFRVIEILPKCIFAKKLKFACQFSVNFEHWVETWKKRNKAHQYKMVLSINCCTGRKAAVDRGFSAVNVSLNGFQIATNFRVNNEDDNEKRFTYKMYAFKPTDKAMFVSFVIATFHYYHFKVLVL